MVEITMPPTLNIDALAPHRGQNENSFPKWSWCFLQYVFLRLCNWVIRGSQSKFMVPSFSLRGLIPLTFPQFNDPRLCIQQ